MHLQMGYWICVLYLEFAATHWSIILWGITALVAHQVKLRPIWHKNQHIRATCKTMRSQTTEIVNGSYFTIFSQNGGHVTDEHQQILVILIFIQFRAYLPLRWLKSPSLFQTLNDTSLLHVHALEPHTLQIHLSSARWRVQQYCVLGIVWFRQIDDQWSACVCFQRVFHPWGFIAPWVPINQWNMT